MANIEIVMVDSPNNTKVYDKKSNSFVVDICYDVEFKIDDEFKIDANEYVAKIKASNDTVMSCYKRNNGSRETRVIISEETLKVLLEKINEVGIITETI